MQKHYMGNSNHSNNQSGLASIIIVTVIISLLALITIGLTRIMDKEYRQATDRELASQANYAAESGMNDARKYIFDQIANGQDPSTPSNSCLSLTPPPPEFVQNGSISGNYTNNPANNIVKYTCVIIDTKPKVLDYENKPVNQIEVFKIVPLAVNGTNPLANLYFSWQNADYGNSNPTGLGPNLPEESAVTASQTGMLRVTIFPAINGSGGVTTDQMVANNSSTYFLYPQFSGNGITALAYGGGAQGKQAVICNQNYQNNSPLPYNAEGGYFCNAQIQIPPALSGNNVSFYYISIMPLYHDLNIKVEASDSSTSPVKISGAQAVIDVTGEGNDILKRLRGRLALYDNTGLPNYTVQSMDTLCKRLRLPIGSSGPGNSYIDDNASANADSAACQPQ